MSYSLARSPLRLPGSADFTKFDGIHGLLCNAGGAAHAAGEHGRRRSVRAAGRGSGANWNG